MTRTNLEQAQAIAKDFLGGHLAARYQNALSLEHSDTSEFATPEDLRICVNEPHRAFNRVSYENDLSQITNRELMELLAGQTFYTDMYRRKTREAMQAAQPEDFARIMHQPGGLLEQFQSRPIDAFNLIDSLQDLAEHGTAPSAETIKRGIAYLQDQEQHLNELRITQGEDALSDTHLAGSAISLEMMKLTMAIGSGLFPAALAEGNFTYLPEAWQKRMTTMSDQFAAAGSNTEGLADQLNALRKDVRPILEEHMPITGTTLRASHDSMESSAQSYGNMAALYTDILSQVGAIANALGITISRSRKHR